MLELEITDISSLPQAAKRFIEILKPGGIYAFNGEMGAGKTTFISEVCSQLGVTDDVSSPTFSLVNEYETADGQTIYHFDCYRLESEQEAFDIGAEEYFDSGNICFIEWPEKIESILPDNCIFVDILVKPDGSRIVKL